MTFIQTMEFAATDKNKIIEIGTEWATNASSSGTARKSILAEDRSNPGHFVWSVFFDSAEEAAANSQRPETGEYAERFTAMTSDGITFNEYDVVVVIGD